MHQFPRVPAAGHPGQSVFTRSLILGDREPGKSLSHVHTREACSINTSRDSCPGEPGLDSQPGGSPRTRGSLSGSQRRRRSEQFRLSSPQRGRSREGRPRPPEGPRDSSRIFTLASQGGVMVAPAEEGSVDPLHLAQDAALVHGQDHLVVPYLLKHRSARELVARLFEVIP